MKRLVPKEYFQKSLKKELTSFSVCGKLIPSTQMPRSGNEKLECRV
ncbi:hypothetical protein HOLDEFILI_02688 [Holdemania filiformis DSM 12042]|uniref:Uncharacterized protein n=1 Tax=Holdemania filiformis DSM 12042 TaxID=545696 RepID=B9YA31_9FIRM|nr:hypothetical protein HOLDEFILI_02688 [Holdemania filiformis DSM 12042]